MHGRLRLVTARARNRTRALGGEAGAAAVEFALVMPVLFLLLFGIFEFGRAYNAQIGLSGAAREGARHMAITSDVNAARTKALATAVMLDTTPTATFTNTSGAAITTCSSGDVVATVSTTMNYNIPFFSSGAWTVAGKAVMRCGG